MKYQRPRREEIGTRYVNFETLPVSIAIRTYGSINAQSRLDLNLANGISSSK